uniref:Epl101 n=1 Tax=Arundo donax TaxID=35708 RepID=A0A0A9ENK2_ARUDO
MRNASPTTAHTFSASTEAAAYQELSCLSIRSTEPTTRAVANGVVQGPIWHLRKNNCSGASQFGSCVNVISTKCRRLQPSGEGGL